MSDSNGEAFTVYYEGTALQLKWAALPPLQRAPALRIVAITEELLLLLTADECLYTARLNAIASELYLQLQRNQVKDVGYCRRNRQLYIVTSNSGAFVQQLNENFFITHDWKSISFDPLELSEEGIPVRSVRCSAEGALFVTYTNDLYAMGSCGDIFNAEAHPKHLRLFDESKEILDIAAGDDFFVIMLQRNFDGQLEDDFKFTSAATRNTLLPTPSPQIKRRNNLEIDNIHDETTKEQQHELNSNSSVRSFSSSKCSSHSQTDQDIARHIQQLMRQGYQLLNTEVHTFGAANNGLLGTGDHMRRNSLHLLQKLERIGVCSIAAGREHSLARTLDGRLYHWGLNSKHQLLENDETTDLSAPTELKLDRQDWNALQRTVLAACCGDYQTVLLNARAELHNKDRHLGSLEQDLLALQMSAGSNHKYTPPLLLAADAYTLHNHRQFQRQYHDCWYNLQLQLRQLLKYCHTVQVLQLYQYKHEKPALKQLQPLCRHYHKVLYLLAALLRSLESFYRGDYSNPAELLFVQQYRECIELFEQYTRTYCDVYAVNTFDEIAQLLPNHSEQPDLVQVFQQPFQVFPYFVQFLEQLLKTRNEYTEHLLAWQEFTRRNRIELELAESTQDFWHRNDRNTKIRSFRSKHRRVILTSTTVPLKLAGNHMSMTSPTFILFSDNLCQIGGGSQVHTYPLTAMWLKLENDNCLQVITPERRFVIAARSHHDKMLWYDQLESSIVAALGQMPGSKLSLTRTTAYQYSGAHPKYANVHAYGRWRNGHMHGNCYLEYADGRCYFGQMFNDEMEGYGKMVIPSVGLYEGYFKAGKFHGHGTYELKDNEVYEGNFRDGFFHGHGMMRSANYTYVGEYQGNARCGYGVLDDMITGEKYMGMFADNKRAGAGICITMNGDYFEGIFANDELNGTGIAVFENGNYYEGELSMWGPTGKGTYYMPSGPAETEDSGIHDEDDDIHRQLVGNVLSGQLAGNWHDVRVLSGTMSMQREFSKYPSSLSALVVDNNRKWLSLFENFEDQLFGPTILIKKKSISSLNISNTQTSPILSTTKQLWNRIAVFMNARRAREKTFEQQDTAYQTVTRSYFGKNISLGFGGANPSNFDKLSLKSTTSLMNSSSVAKSSIFDVSQQLQHAHSQDTLCDNDLQQHIDDSAYNNISYLQAQLDSWANDSAAPSLRSSVDSALNLSGTYSNNNSYSSSCNQYGLDYVPSFGINTLTAEDVVAIREYLMQAFKDRHHPLYLLNQQIAQSFYTSYGCWKMKPTPILAKQAMREWESISKRVYKFVRKMFPALPDDFCILEPTRELVSHITLLYPIVLSEGIYSTLFVLYANKYSGKEEMYRQNLIYADKLKDNELAQCLCLDTSLLPVVSNELFLEAIQTLKQLQEKYSPKAMLTVIEHCMQQITDAHKIQVENSNTALIGADSIMPLTLFLVLRATVPHLGAELALLDDLTGGANFQFEMNGMAGYCYTTLKAAYEHITSRALNRT